MEDVKRLLVTSYVQIKVLWYLIDSSFKNTRFQRDESNRVTQKLRSRENLSTEDRNLQSLRYPLSLGYCG